MIALVVLAGILIGSAYRLLHVSHTERQRWRHVLTIGAILVVIYAARAVISGTAGDRDVRIAVSSDAVGR